MLHTILEAIRQYLPINRLSLEKGARGSINPDFTNGLFFNPPNSNYHICKVDINVQEFLLYLQHEDVQAHLNENNNKLSITVKKKKQDQNKWYGSLDDLSYRNKKELTSKEHSPDRVVENNVEASGDDDDGLPF